MKKLSLSLAMVLFALSMAWAQRVINGSVSDDKGA
ncbi:MAG: hypothetical protein RL329_310, partial [Bacteroidota bacterium]